MEEMNIWLYCCIGTMVVVFFLVCTIVLLAEIDYRIQSLFTNLIGTYNPEEHEPTYGCLLDDWKSE